MMKVYKTEINPTPQQIALIHQTFGNTRFVYNNYITINLQNIENDKPIISGYTYSKQINNNPDRPDWLTAVSSKALKNAIMTAERTIRNYTKGKSGEPTYRKKTKHNSFYLIGQIKVERHRIFVPTLKWLRLKEYGYIPKNIKSVTISMKNNRYYISCLSHEKKDERIATSNEGVGIDFGLKNQFITKDKVFPSINQTQKIKKIEKRLKREQRSLSRKYRNNMKNVVYYKSGKKKGQLRSFEWIRPLRECKNINKKRLQVSKIYERLTNIRTEYNRKCLNEIIEQKPRFISIEDLNIKGMMKNKHLSKAISNAQWYKSRVYLQNQCEKKGIELRVIDRYYASSKLCSTCGEKNKELKLKERTWECKHCGSVHDRDVNAAINIERSNNYKVLTRI